jgi:TolB protein
VASGFGGNPAWSSDGKEIAFIAAGPEGRDIWQVPASGGARSRLTHNGMVTPTVAGLSFSPDGRQIALASSRGGKSDVWTVPTSGGDAHQVTLSGRVTWMSFSPDSRRIAFDSYSDIWVVPASGGVPTRLLDWPTWEFAPAWSPDGENIAIASQRTQTDEVADGNWHIWLVPDGGGEATYLTEGMWPSWSPDGTQILFARNDDIWEIPAIGGTPTLQLKTPESENWPRYSPDGSQILFMRSDTSVDANIWIADVSGMTNTLSLTSSGNAK